MIDLLENPTRSFSSSRSSELLELKRVPWSELKPHIDVFEADGKARTGLLVYNNPINRRDPLGLYYWQTDYWANLSVNGNWAQQIAANILGPISATLPNAGGGSGGTYAFAGPGGSIGAANMTFAGSDPCQGNNASYTTVGYGVGTPQIGVTSGLALGWGNQLNPNASSFTGDFTEANFTFFDVSVTLWGGGAWSEITVGLAAGEPPISASIQTVNYQFPQ